MSRIRIGLLISLVVPAVLGGCSLGPPPLAPPRPYPAGAVQAGSLDVQVIRDDTTITYTNTTGATLPEGTLWVNKAFARPVDALPPGATASYNLYSFYNRFGEAFRAGGFFSTEVPLSVVMVQLEAEPGELAMLVPGGLPEITAVSAAESRAGTGDDESGEQTASVDPPPYVVGLLVAQGKPDER